MELIYMYLKCVENREFGYEFNWGLEHEIHLDKEKKKISIEKKVNQIPKNFFGERVTNLNLIVGENGSGKTTVLELIGLKRCDRRCDFTHQDQWFCVYALEENKYLVEGNNWSIVPSSPTKLDINPEFSLIVEYKNVEKLFSVLEYTQSYKENENRYPYRDKAIYAYRACQGHEKDRDKAKDYTHTIRRKYIDSKVALIEKFIFLCNDYRKFQKNIQESNFFFELKTRNSKSTLLEHENRIELNVYGRNEFIFDRSNIILIHERQGVHFSSLNEDFIIKYLEGITVLMWNSMKKNGVNDSLFESDDFVYWSKTVIDEIKKVKLPSLKSYKMTKQYLLNIIEIFIKELVRINLDDEEKNNPKFNCSLKAYEDFISSIEKLDEKFFINDEIIRIPLSSENSIEQSVLDLLRVYDKYSLDFEKGNDLARTLNISPSNLSSGENQLIENFTSINHAIKRLLASSGNYENIILLIDEPETHLHPEWNRRYIDSLLKYLNSVEFDVKFQVIIATHSPYFLSDVPHSRITKINQARFISNSKYGFASNYYNIITDSFFLENSIGEFASGKIKEIINLIRNSKEEKEFREIGEIINLIDDPIIKQRLQQKLNNQQKRIKLSSEGLTREKNKIQQELAELEKELKAIEKLEMRGTNND